MIRMSVAGLVAAAGLVASAGAAEPAGRYAIVVRKDVADGPWGKVVRSLEAKHKGKVFAYDKSPEEVRQDAGRTLSPQFHQTRCAIPSRHFRPAFDSRTNRFDCERSRLLRH